MLLENNARVFYLDFETSGLSVSTDNIVEIGLLESAGARFQTVVCPSFFIDSGPAVHGISNQELAQGPSFAVAFSRMCAFIENLLNMAVDEGGQRLIDRPVALIAAHNGKNLSGKKRSEFFFLFLLGPEKGKTYGKRYSPKR